VISVSQVTFSGRLCRPEASHDPGAASDDRASENGGKAALLRRAGGAQGPGVLGCHQPVGDGGLGDLVVHAAVHFDLPTPWYPLGYEDPAGRLTASLLAMYEDH
jgi:hypothetical protein